MKNFLILTLNGLAFPDLHKKICELDNFNGDPKGSNEKILEAIQMLWIEESL